MPIPDKNKGEQSSDFMGRCMGSKVMKKDYPDHNQRIAVCMSKATANLDTQTMASAIAEFNECGWTEELTSFNIVIPNDDDYVDFEDGVEECTVASLWENIRKKKKREGKKYRPAKPGDKDRPDPDAFKKAQASDNGQEGGMAKAQLKKIAQKAMAIHNMLGEEDELEGWVQDNISKADLHIESAYDYMMYSEPYEDETESMAAEYQGRKVKLNKPFRTTNGPKKFAVYTKNESGKVVIVRFGDPNMTIKKNNPERRKSFRARHGCDKNPGPKWKAKYWSCQWSW